MDILRAVLVFGTVLSPLVAAAAIAAVGLSARPRSRLAAWLAVLGAVASACCAVGVLINRVGADVSTESPLTLGRWFVNGPSDLLRVSFGLRFSALTAALAAALAFATGSLFAASRTDADGSPVARWMPLGGSLVLFASIGVVASANLAELFVFWEIATAVVYVMSSLSATSAQQAIAARKLVLVLSVSDAFLLCAVFILAAGFGTLDFRVLFDRPEVWARAAGQRAGLVDLIGLCVLGATVGRCGLVPFLGWVGDLAARPARVAALIEAIALLPSGAVLLVRCFPLLNSAEVILPLAAFVGGASAFCLAVCAVADVDFRRASAFGCASVTGTVLLGLSRGEPASPAIALALMTLFVPSAAAIVLSGAARPDSRARKWSIVAIVLLFSGVGGQACLLGVSLESLFAGSGRDAPALLLAVLLAACGQYLAAVSVIRPLVRGGLGDEMQTGASSSSASAVDQPLGDAESSMMPLIGLVCFALVAGLLAGFVSFRAARGMFTGGTLVYVAIGLIPGVGGLLAGAQSARSEWKVFPGDAVNGLLMRLGHSGFYFDAFLFLFVLVPLRGVAGLARFIDWAVIDTLATGGPASLFESAASFFGPLQHRGVFFYLFTAMLGTVVLSGLMIWLQG
jgi:NADH-quinone oxidoreductase subunit L